MKISAIIPYERNAKKHPQKQVEQIARSIEEFGFNQPIVIDKKNVVIVGHGRLAAAHLLGLEDVPVIKVDLTEEQAKAYRLADNKLNESEWDMELVIDELRSLSEEMVDLTGFDTDLLIDPEDKDDVVPEAPKKARTKLGDIYEITTLEGRSHRVMCGDSTSAEDVAKLMGDHKADMVFTDPPYNIAYKGQGKNTSNTIQGDDVEDSAFHEFLLKVFKNFKEHTKDGAGNYVFHASRTQAVFEVALHENGFEIKNQLIWNKPNSALGWGNYRWKHEPFFYAGQKGKKLAFYGDRTHATVWDFHKSEAQLIAWAKKEKRLEQSGLTTVWSMKREPTGAYVHPTQKPVELITYAIFNSSKPGDLILDLFLGSGATLIAGEKTGRDCYGMELDPIYVDVIIERFVNYTEGGATVTCNGKEIVW